MKITICDERARESDASNVGSQKEGCLNHVGGWVGGERGEVVDVGGNAGKHSGHTHQRMESCNQLRQISDFNPLKMGLLTSSDTVLREEKSLSNHSSTSWR